MRDHRIAPEGAKGDESDDLSEKNTFARADGQTPAISTDRAMMGPLAIENVLMSMVGT